MSGAVVTARTRASSGTGRRAVWLAIAAAAVLATAACGGRRADPVEIERDVDSRLSCRDLEIERTANLRAIEDKQSERNANRRRTLMRFPKSLITGGIPIGGILLADLSLAIYEEIDTLEQRNARIMELEETRKCALIRESERARPPRRASDVDAYEALLAPDAEAADPLDASLSEEVLGDDSPGDERPAEAAPIDAAAPGPEPAAETGGEASEPSAADPLSDAYGTGQPATEAPASEAPASDDADAPPAEGSVEAPRTVLTRLAEGPAQRRQ